MSKPVGKPVSRSDGKPDGTTRQKPAASSKTIQRLALTKSEAAESLGISVDSLELYVLPDVRVCRAGRLVLISVDELRRWLDRNSAATWAVRSR